MKHFFNSLFNKILIISTVSIVSSNAYLVSREPAPAAPTPQANVPTVLPATTPAPTQTQVTVPTVIPVTPTVVLPVVTTPAQISQPIPIAVPKKKLGAAERLQAVRSKSSDPLSALSAERKKFLIGELETLKEAATTENEEDTTQLCDAIITKLNNKTLQPGQNAILNSEEGKELISALVAGTQNPKAGFKLFESLEKNLSSGVDTVQAINNSIASTFRAARETVSAITGGITSGARQIGGGIASTTQSSFRTFVNLLRTIPGGVQFLVTLQFLPQTARTIASGLITYGLFEGALFYLSLKKNDDARFGIATRFIGSLIKNHVPWPMIGNVLKYLAAGISTFGAYIYLIKFFGDHPELWSMKMAAQYSTMAALKFAGVSAGTPAYIILGLLSTQDLLSLAYRCGFNQPKKVMEETE